MHAARRPPIGAACGRRRVRADGCPATTIHDAKGATKIALAHADAYRERIAEQKAPNEKDINLKLLAQDRADVMAWIEKQTVRLIEEPTTDVVPEAGSDEKKRQEVWFTEEPATSVVSEMASNDEKFDINFTKTVDGPEGHQPKQPEAGEPDTGAGAPHMPKHLPTQVPRLQLRSQGRRRMCSTAGQPRCPPTRPRTRGA